MSERKPLELQQLPMSNGPVSAKRRTISTSISTSTSTSTNSSSKSQRTAQRENPTTIFYYSPPPSSGLTSSLSLSSISSLNQVTMNEPILPHSSSFTNEPSRYVEDLRQWHSENDLPDRRLMIQHIMALTQNHGTSEIEQNEWRKRSPNIAKRMELSLYFRAASYREYIDLNTLKRRVQALIYLSYHDTVASQTIENLPEPPRKRRRVTTSSSPSSLSISSLRTTTSTFASLSTSKNSFLFSNFDLTRLVYSFLDTSTILIHRRINRSAYHFLPTCVTEIRLPMDTMYHIYFQVNARFLSQFPNLSILEIQPHLSHLNCVDLVKANTKGEKVICLLGHEMKYYGACQSLRQLRFQCAFTNTLVNNGIHSLCDALRNHGKGSPNLQEISLCGNSLSDYGMVDLAYLLRKGYLLNLRKLDLRCNFIGEVGVKRLITSLMEQKCQKLNYLGLGSNIITDYCIEPINQFLMRKQCPLLKFIGLEDNFLTNEGVKTIIRATIQGGMIPKLHKILRK